MVLGIQGTHETAAINAWWYLSSLIHSISPPWSAIRGGFLQNSKFFIFKFTLLGKHDGVDLGNNFDMFILWSNARPSNAEPNTSICLVLSAAPSNTRQIKMHLAVGKTGYFFLFILFFFITNLCCTKHLLCMHGHYGTPVFLTLPCVLSWIILEHHVLVSKNLSINKT